MSEVILRTEMMSKSYALGKQPVQALSNLDLKVNKGEFVAIMGPSGSGKTTLLNVLGCIDKPTSGKVILDGVDVARLSEKELCKIRKTKIGFVFQTFNLMPYLNAMENVELPMEGTRKTGSEKKKRSQELLAIVGLSGREKHRPNKLSAGEQQRVAIARALANDPAIILADEPTGNLDSKNKHELMRLLADLNIQRGTTIVMVTHDGQVASHTDRMLLLQDGKITKEKQGVLLARKKLVCPYCGSKVQLGDYVCPNCGKKLGFHKEQTIQ